MDDAKKLKSRENRIRLINGRLRETVIVRAARQACQMPQNSLPKAADGDAKA